MNQNWDNALKQRVKEGGCIMQLYLIAEDGCYHCFVLSTFYVVIERSGCPDQR